MLKGSPVSAGIGIGKALILQQDEIVVVHRYITDKEKEKHRFVDAVQQFCEEIQIASEKVRDNIGVEEAGIIGVQSAIVQDPELTREIFEIIDEKSVGAEYAFDVVCEKYIKLFDALEDEMLSARSADFRDIKIRLLSILMGLHKPGLQDIPENSVLVAEDISPSQAALLDNSKVSAIVTQMGTRFSHIAIIARALQIPTVVAVDNACDAFEQGDYVIVDGDRGDVLRNPDDEKLAQYSGLIVQSRNYFQSLLSYRNKRTVTQDGKRVLLMANFAVPQELYNLAESNADGVGLFRTEFLYMHSTAPPTVGEQLAHYRRVLQAMGGKRVVIRTLDAGGDKDIPYLHLAEEDNPFLGLRGIRFCLAHPDIFKTQLSALLQAGLYGKLSILLPMIATVEELLQAKMLLEEVKEELRQRKIPFAEDVPLGVMIETPSAALCAQRLAKEADFFSLGTNDLTQYTLAVDRTNDTVASLYSPLHPAVLRLMRYAVESAHRAGILIEICGEIPSDMLLIPLLIGMGVDGLSVSSGAVLQVRKCIAEIDHNFWKENLDQVLELSTPEEVAEYVRGLW